MEGSGKNDEEGEGKSREARRRGWDDANGVVAIVGGC